MHNKQELMDDFMRLMRRIDHRYFLKLKQIEPLIMLIDSLEKDVNRY